MKNGVDGGLRQLFKSRIISAQWTPIETGAVASGVPDAEFCFPGGISGWVEFKDSRRGEVGLRPMQVSWIDRRARLGGRVFVAVRREDELWLFSGSCAREIKAGGLAGARPVGTWRGGPKSWDWAAVARLLQV